MFCCRRTIVAISLPHYGCHLVVYIHPFYCLHCHICGSLTRRRRLLHAALSNYHFYIYSQLFFSLGLGYCDFSFLLFNCRPIRVTRMLFSWSSLVAIAVNRFLKSHHSFHISYIRKNTPPNYPHPTRTCSHVLQRHVCYTVSSRLHTALLPDCVALSIMHLSSSFPSSIIILNCSVTTVTTHTYVHTYDIRTADSSFYFLAML